ncbi:glycyl-radical enzyme activating protein, partial [Anaerotignum sp.]|uniref:glycyl-radical enzyme activating protein n=1 Tax=Anaerotignum sp. TaxID=2039241 RepID=UPI0027B891B3
MGSMKGYVMQLQPFSVNDGEGIRTTIFMAGCPLRCKWCSNPEGFDQKPKTAFYEKLCIGCGLCTTVCHVHNGINLNDLKQREKCDGCGKCADVCPKNAKKRMVVEKEVSEIVEEVKKHRLFYMQSGGGITFSGGETTMQREFLNELSETLYDMGFHLAMETCGYFDFDALKPVLQRMDLIFMDLKHMDSEKHAYFTGVGNEKILENIKRLKELPAEIVIRIPVIKGVNADVENIKASAVY